MSPINGLGVIKDNSFYKYFVPTGLDHLYCRRSILPA
jgi:hypothetical protein